MSKSLVVAGDTYLYPENRDNPGWGEDGTAWAEAVTTVLGNVAGQGDILISTATIANNTGPANINGFAFDPAVVRAAICEFSIYRKTDTNEVVEAGTLYITYKSVAMTFEITQVGSASSGVTLSITSGGQVQYTSDNLSGANYVGTMKFRARAMVQ